MGHQVGPWVQGDGCWRGVCSQCGTGGAGAEMWGDGAGDGWLLCWMCSGGEKANGGYVLQAGGIYGCSRQGVQW
ncbi:hypothetical protein, partial [Xylella fastidiosa]